MNAPRRMAGVIRPAPRLADVRCRDESVRVARLHAYARGASGALDHFSAIAQAAADLCGTPSAMISLLDQGHWWNLAASGWDGPARGQRRSSLCERTCRLDALLEIADTRAERCWDAEPLVAAPPHVRFYAAVPVVTADGITLGTLAVLAPSAWQLAPGQKRALERLAALTMALLEACASARPGMLAALAERNGEEIYLVDMLTLRLVFASETARQRLGYCPERLAGLRAPALSPAYQRDLFIHLRQLARPGLGGYHALETQHLRADGGGYAVEMRVQAGLDRDCTLWRSVLDGLVQAGRHAQAVREAVGQVAGSVTSDLNAALGVITDHAELLVQRLPCGLAGQQQLDRILGATVQARGLVSRMAAFAGVDGAAAQPMDAVVVVTRALAAVRAALPARVGLTFDSALEAAPLLADPAQVELVVANLCGNVRESIHGAGAIAVRLAGAPATPGYLWLQVGGSGCASAPRGQGRGQLLSAVLAAVSLLRGEIQVDSTPGGGTRINLYLPLAPGIPTGLVATI